MSEHEGVGLPLIESMWMGLPVLAYASSGVPGTLGDAGVLFHEQDFPTLAELVSMLLDEDDLRARLIAGQRRRVEAFRAHHVRQRFLDVVSGLSAAVGSR
jgi:glycosyltransferase involved in cell wall biosynthesis